MKGGFPAVQDDPAVPGRKRSSDKVTAGLFFHSHRHSSRTLMQVAVSTPGADNNQRYAGLNDSILRGKNAGCFSSDRGYYVRIKESEQGYPNGMSMSWDYQNGTI